MKIAAVQRTFQPGNLQKNLEIAADAVRQGAREGCELLLFPELCDLGYDLRAVARHGPQSWRDFAPAMRALAREQRICLVMGVCQNTPQGLANALVSWGPQGNCLASYHKLHLFRHSAGDESRAFIPGNTIMFFDLREFRFGLSLCYDLRFPEMYRDLALHGCDVFLLSAAWPQARIAHWNTLCAARAVENQCYLLGANHSGGPSPTSFGGHSLCIDPNGETLTAGSATEELVFMTLSRDALREARKAFRSLRDRRPRIYPGHGLG